MNEKQTQMSGLINWEEMPMTSSSLEWNVGSQTTGDMFVDKEHSLRIIWFDAQNACTEDILLCYCNDFIIQLELSLVHMQHFCSGMINREEFYYFESKSSWLPSRSDTERELYKYIQGWEPVQEAITTLFWHPNRSEIPRGCIQVYDIGDLYVTSILCINHVGHSDWALHASALQ